MSKQKKLLTIDDLVAFCRKNKLNTFSSRESGYQLAVQVPSTFEIDDDPRRGLMKLKIKVCHTGLNRNGSYISEQNAKRAMSSLKDRPLLAYIHQLDDGTWDFETHNASIVELDDGTFEYEYEEREVGHFTADEPYLEYDPDQDKTYVIAYAIVPEDYTRAAEILRRKGGSKNSCELMVDGFAYNTKEDYLEITDFYFSASTLLGSYDDGTEVGEGMVGSRADIVEFSAATNSVLQDVERLNERIVEIQEQINKFASCFNIENSEEGGTEVTKFEELLQRYGKTVEDIDFDYANMSDEELEAKFAELFDEAVVEDETSEETDEADDDSTVVTEDADVEVAEIENEVDDNDDADVVTDTTVVIESEEEDIKETEEIGTESETEPTCMYSVTLRNQTKTFAVSLNQKISNLYELVNATYADNDGTWYSVEAFDDYLVMVDFWNGTAYRQSYSEDGDTLALVGDRVRVYMQYLTQEEIDSLESMKSQLRDLITYKEGIEAAELHAQREAVLEASKFAGIRGTTQFKALMSKMDEYSVADLEKEAKLILADATIANMPHDEISDGGKVGFSMKPTRKSTKTYGTLFTE